MGKDYPDWGGYVSQQATYPLKDLAEAVVRLGSPVIMDRRGAVAFIEDFEHGLGRVLAFDEAAAGGALIQSGTFFSKGFALQAGVAGVAGNRAGAYVKMGHLPLSQWGMACVVGGAISAYRVGMRLYIYEDGRIYEFDASFRISQLKAYYLNAAGGYTDLGAIPPLLPEKNCYNHFKMVIDPTTKKYLRVMINDTEFTDIDALCYDAGATVYRNIQMEWYVQQIAGPTGTVGYFDNLILTYAEP